MKATVEDVTVHPLWCDPDTGGNDKTRYLFSSHELAVAAGKGRGYGRDAIPSAPVRMRLVTLEDGSTFELGQAVTVRHQDPTALRERLLSTLTPEEIDAIREARR